MFLLYLAFFIRLFVFLSSFFSLLTTFDQLLYFSFSVEKPPAPSRVQLVRASTATLEVCWGTVPTGMLSLLTVCVFLTYLQKRTPLDTLLINVTKCPLKSKRKPSRCNLRVSVCVRLSFSLASGFAVYVSLRRRVDLYSPYVLPEVTVKFTRKARRHFVSLIESGIRLIECISGHNSSKAIY